MAAGNSLQISWLHFGKSMFYVSKNHYLGGRNSARFQPRGLQAKRYATLYRNIQMNNQQKMLELLNPEVFKSNLLLSSVFIAYFENTVDYLIDTPREFFCNGFNEKGDIISPDYKTKVLKLDTKPLNASLLWFKSLNAIDDDEILVFDILRRYRNKLSHELMKILLEEGLETEMYIENLGKLFDFRIKLEKWWILNFELDFSDIENPQEIEEKDIVSGGEMIFNLIQDLLSDNPEKANYYLE